MNISYSWLKDLAPKLTESPREMADRLAMYGAPVDEVVAIGAPLRDVMIARVVTHSAIRMPTVFHFVKVDAGNGELLRWCAAHPT